MARFHNRYLLRPIQLFLKNRMVFLGGPRQAGKTSLCLRFLKPPSETNPAYLNWDDPTARHNIKKADFPADQKTLYFNEIHKFKNLLEILPG